MMMHEDEAFGVDPGWVYPRVCGGTPGTTRAHEADQERVYPRVCGGTSC